LSSSVTTPVVCSLAQHYRRAFFHFNRSISSQSPRMEILDPAPPRRLSRAMFAVFCIPLVHVIACWIISFMWRSESLLNSACNGFTQRSISIALLDVHTIFFTAVVLCQVALLIFHFILKLIPRYYVTTSAIFTTGASAVFSGATLLFLVQLHSTAAECQISYTTPLLLLSISFLLNGFLFAIHLSRWRSEQMRHVKQRAVFSVRSYEFTDFSIDP
ncbi:hypothetical protein PMAYCL1PPCAC_13495, partial [Pristionchus mayeri]